MPRPRLPTTRFIVSATHPFSESKMLGSWWACLSIIFGDHLHHLWWSGSQKWYPWQSSLLSVSSARIFMDSWRLVSSSLDRNSCHIKDGNSVSTALPLVYAGRLDKGHCGLCVEKRRCVCTEGKELVPAMELPLTVWLHHVSVSLWPQFPVRNIWYWGSVPRQCLPGSTL